MVPPLECPLLVPLDFLSVLLVAELLDNTERLSQKAESKQNRKIQSRRVVY